MVRRMLIVSLLMSAAIRAAAATFNVTNLADSGSGTLRQAIQDANNAGPGAHTIIFTNLPSPFRIAPLTAYPTITNSILLDGKWQAGYTGTPIVHLVGTSFPSSPLIFAGNNGGAQALRASNFTNGSPFLIWGVSNRISGCIIQSNQNGVVISSGAAYTEIGGANASNQNLITHNSSMGVSIVATGRFNRVRGNQVLFNQFNGIYVTTRDVTIGGATAGERNQISGNFNVGIYLFSSNANNCVILGNYIGTDAAGTSSLANTNGGLWMFQSWSNQIGNGTVAGRNIISGNGDDGISVTGADARGNQMLGNYIGVGSSGNRLGNGRTIGDGNGIYLSGSGNIIGLNTISGNLAHGILMTADYACDENLIFGNGIGVSPAGNVAISNNYHGILLSSGNSNRIGSVALPRNIISGNGRTGIRAEGLLTRYNTIVNNYIGTDINGLAAIPNIQEGIVVENGRDLAIGDPAGGGNLISGNQGQGIYVIGNNTLDLSIQNNIIGLDITGTNSLANTGTGLVLQSGTNVAVGVAGRNVISGNGIDGIYINQLATRVTVANNVIGLSVFGNLARPNDYGIQLNAGGKDYIITNNVVSGNDLSGIYVFSIAPSNTVISGNIIGLNSNATIDVPNGHHGIHLQQAGHVTIGGTNATARNIIAGNLRHGIYLDFATNGPVTIAGNSIGMNGAGTLVFGNRNDGIQAYLSRQIQIGGPTPAWRNLIGGNASNGVNFYQTRQSIIAGNYIGTDGGLMLARSNFNAGVYLFGAGSISNDIDNNVISGNGGPGLHIDQQPSFIRVRGNRIGLGSGNLQPLPNRGPGVLVNGSEKNLYGGYSTSDANRIAFNLGPGIAITSIVFGLRFPHEIYGNLIYSNAGIAIDLNHDGVTPNDPTPDTDNGYANDFQNFPELSLAVRGSTAVFGKLASDPGKTYRVELFGTDTAQGLLFLGATNITLPPDGTGTWSFVSAISLNTGATVYATASTTDRGTSEFSPGIVLSESDDTDGDLMPGWWESLYGLNPSVSNAVNSDADADGYTDLDEWIAFTEPNNSNSTFAIVLITAPASKNIFVPSTSTRRYQLEGSPSLINPTWSVIQSNIPGNDALLGLIDPANQTHRVFRVNVKLP